MEQYRKSPRAEFIDYDEGEYFVTICTRNKEHYFGEIRNNEIFLSKIGKFAGHQLEDVRKYYDYIHIPAYVIMPNHVHAIVCIRRDMPLACKTRNILNRCPNPSLRTDLTCRRHVPTLSRFINSFKGVVTKYSRSINTEFGWQSRYHDHMIRNDKDRNIF